MLYRQLLKDDFDKLPPALRSFTPHLAGGEPLAA